MTVEHEVQVAGAQCLGDLDARVPDQVLGRDENLMLLEVERGLVIGDQHPVVRRDQHIALWQAVAQSTRLDQDRLEMLGLLQIVGGQITAPCPTDFLDPVIAGDNTVADLQLFHRLLALWCRHKRARREAGDDALDIRELQRARDIAIIIEELDRAIFMVGRS